MGTHTGWRGAALRWDKPSGGGNLHRTRAGEEQRPAGTSPAVAGICTAHGLARSGAPLGQAQRWREFAPHTGWRGAAPTLGQAQRWREFAPHTGWRGARVRWDKPSGGGNLHRTRAGEERAYAGTSPAVAGMLHRTRAGGEQRPLGQAQRWREWAPHTGWRGAAPRWDKPSGGGNGHRTRAGGEQRPAGTSPAVAGICRLVAIRFLLDLKTGLTPHPAATGHKYEDARCDQGANADVGPLADVGSARCATAAGGLVGQQRPAV